MRWLISNMVWAGTWTQEEIAEGRAEGLARRISYYEALVRKQWPWFRRFWNFVNAKSLRGGRLTRLLGNLEKGGS